MHPSVSLPAATLRRVLQVVCCALPCWFYVAPRSGQVSAAEKTAAEPAAATADWPTLYLDGLRQRGWHDAVLEYLDRAAEDPLASPGFLQRLGFERAITQAASAKQTPSARQRQELLTEAAAGFLKYASDYPGARLEVEALSQASSIFVQQSLSGLAQGDRLPAQATSQRESLQEESRQFLAKASEALEKVRASCAVQLKSVPKGAALQNDPGARALRGLLENKQAEAQFQQAKLLFDNARTYAKDSALHKSGLREAAATFAQLDQDYKDKLIGFLGRLYEGRCYQQLGESADALKRFHDLVDEPIANPDFRRLVSRAYRRRAEIHLAAQDAKLAIQECREWLDDSRNDELKKTEWLALAYRLANAYEAHSLTPAGSGDAKRLRGEARKLLRGVAASPGKFQREARAALASSGGSNKPVTVGSFSDALTAGKDALQQMNSSQFAAKLAANNNPSSVGDLQQQANLHKAQATHYFQTCLNLADEETPQDKLNAARYYLCWLFWEADRIPEAALLGNFLARRYSDSQFALGAAKLALAAYERMYIDARQGGAQQASYESEQLARMAKLLASRWPETDEAAVAINILLNIALRENRVDDAEAMLKQLPATSRGQAELSLGGSLWLRATAAGQDTPAEKLAQLKQRALEMLSRGFEAVRTQDDPSESAASGALFLCQALLVEQEFARAIEVLRDPGAGPLTLVREKAAVTSRPKFILNVYKAALRAFVLVEPPERQAAQQIMEALEATLANDEDAAAQLTRIYLSLGVQVQRQLAAHTAAGQAEKAVAVAGAFEDLVQRVSQHGDQSGSWQIQNWIAQTNLQLGQGLRGETAMRYFVQAESAYRALLAKVTQDPSFASSAMAVLAARKRLGDCLQSQQKFAEALDQYTAVLQSKPNMLELQQSAAACLQAWGASEKKSEKLELAIRGALPQDNKKNLVWGWLRLADIADHHKRKAVQAVGEKSPKAQKYHDLFFAARLQVARARFTSASFAKGDHRKKQQRAAQRNLTSMQRLYPDLGGPRSKAAYLELLNEIVNTPP